MSPAITLDPSIIGQAEKHHNALLHRVLAGTGIDEAQWITLSQAAAAGGTVDRERHIATLAAKTTWTPTVVATAATRLTDRGLLLAAAGGELVVTEAGGRLVADLRSRTSAVLGRVYGVVPAADLAIAGRVLAAITAGLSRELED
ncbi:MarR family transcriptional regulator [Nocardia nova]|uniref:MarR family transcriptional regulator n=1 Tax=Nocardia nova TaxID=37330 RepID=UPI000CE9B790|nr:MarR family transcriptional regulator [Nocardia nova]